MLPVIPHIANECLVRLNYNEKIKWPKIISKYLKSEKIKIVVQINGKKKGIIEVVENIEEEKLIKQIKESSLIEKHTRNKKLIKTIFVKNKLINYLIN